MHPLHTLIRRLPSLAGRILSRRCRWPLPRRRPRRRKAISTCGSRIRSRSKPARRSRSSNSFPTAARTAANSSRSSRAGSRSCRPMSQFRRVPVMFQERWVPLAKIYYTLEALGEESRLSPDVFIALHGKGVHLAGQDVLRLGGEPGPRPEEGRGHVQLVRDRRQGQPRAHARADYQVAIGAADRRRRQVRQQSRGFAPCAMPPLIDALVVKARAERAEDGCERRERSALVGRRRRSVFITGASSGIGRRARAALCRAGRDRSACSRAAAPSSTRWPRRLPAGRVAVYAGDVRDADALARAAADFIARFGAPDVVIANAGISRGALTEHAEDLPTFRAVFDTNVARHRPHVPAVRRGDARGRRGALVGIASIAGFRGLPGSGAYSASKAAAITYLESLRVELRGTGVAVVTICPGYIATPMTAKNPYPMPFVLRRGRGRAAASCARSGAASDSMCCRGRWRSSGACCACCRARSTMRCSRTRRASRGDPAERTAAPRGRPVPRLPRALQRHPQADGDRPVIAVASGPRSPSRR